jgi:hypothetical protein
MSDNYAKLVSDNINRLFEAPPTDLERNIPATKDGTKYLFRAFGEDCCLSPDGITLNGSPQTGVPGILLSLYALTVTSEACITEPLKAYKEFPGTMPYVGAFATHTENILLPHVDAIKRNITAIAEALNGSVPDKPVSGDFSFIVYSLPKLALCYIFYEADDDFPPSVTCLYSNNASSFMPNDALADVGEYTSKKIIRLINSLAG